MPRRKKQHFREGDRDELKLSFDRETVETLCAFANTRGGVIRIGVDDGGDVVGVTVGKETVQRWTNQVKMATSPSIVPDVAVEDHDGCHVVMMSVGEFPIKPVACRGRYYKRVGNANHLMTIAEAAECHLRTFNRSWDYYQSQKRDVESISVDKVAAFVEMANRYRETPITDAPLEVLSKFELMRDGRITNGCYLMFTADDTADTTVEMGRFETDTIVKDSARSQTDLFGQVEQMLGFIRKHISKRSTITGDAQRDEQWEYPMDALRELVLNAVVHRDYTSASDSVLKVYNDRVVLFNPGKLPDGLSVESLLSGAYVSTPRNRQIAELFKEAGLIEKYGSGIARVCEAFRRAGGRSPMFEETVDGFMVTVFAQGGSPPKKGSPQKTHQKTAVGSHTKDARPLTELEGRLLLAIEAQPSATRSALAGDLGVSQETVKEYTVRLKRKQVLVRVGGRNGGYWVVTRGSPQTTPYKTPQKTEETLSDLEQRILSAIQSNPSATRRELALSLELSQDTVKEYMDRLKKKRVLKREGGRKVGRWVVVRRGVQE